MEVTVLMPCLNEQETLETCIIKAQRAIEKNNLVGEILIADNGSTDNSLLIAESLGVRVVHIVEKGYGITLRKGIENSNGKYVIIGDSDDSYDFTDILPFIVKLREGYDLVIGNRFKGEIKENAMPFLHRYLGNPVLSYLARLFFKLSIGDFHCGLRAFNRTSLLNVNFSTTGMEFASEMIVKSSLKRLKITEIPTNLYPDGRSRPPHLRTWQDGWRHLKFLLLYSPRWLFLYPGFLVFLTGLVGTITLALGSVNIMSANFDISTMLYFAALIVIGCQVATFYFFSNIIATTLGLSAGVNDNLFNKFRKHFSLEKGLIAGTATLICGLLLSLYSLTIWHNSAFGNLDPDHIFRFVIPAVTCLILGVQVIFNSFFVGVLDLLPGYSTTKRDLNQ